MGIEQGSFLNCFKGKFFRNVVTLMSGTAIAQIANLIFIPFITRLYGPEAFGGLGFYSSLLGFLTPLAALCYPLALVLPKRKIEARIIFEISLKLALVLSLLTGSVLFMLERLTNGYIPFYGSYLLVPVGMFLSLVVMAYTHWAIRYGKFRLVAATTILATLSAGFFKVILGYYYPSATTLILVSIFILLFNIILFSIYSNVGYKFFDILYVKRIHFVIAKKYLRFPIFRTPHALMAVVSQTAPIFLLMAFYGSKYAGYFALTRMVLSAPVSLIGKAVYNVAYPKISERYNAGLANSKFIITITLALGGLSTLPLLIIFFVGESIFSYVFGEEWQVSGIYAAWVSIWFAFNFSNKAAAAAVSVYNMDDFLFRNGLLNMILSLIGFLLGAIYFKSDVVSVALFSLFGVVCQYLLISNVVNVVRNSDNSRHKISRLLNNE